MTEAVKFVTSIEGIDKDNIPPEVIQSVEPLVIKQLVGGWPIVERARKGNRDLVDYVKSFYNGRPTVVCKTPPQAQGRLFYNENLTKLDYESYKGRIDETLDEILAGTTEENPPGFYIASNIIDTHLPGFREHNDLTVPRKMSPFLDPETVSIWIGSATTASCHFDALDNIACCVAGRRRFTLFPPDQVANLYPGPLEPTPGGQVITLVDFKNPDFDAFPRFAEARKHAYVAELEPGDALFLPSMWWHHVEALDPFNILINYWWNDAPRYLTSGMNALYLAMLGIRDKPKHEREGWRHLFNYYIFDGPEMANEKIPAEARGLLETLDDVNARKLRAMLINKLNR
jgi:hypothetical protein